MKQVTTTKKKVLASFRLRRKVVLLAIPEMQFRFVCGPFSILLALKNIITYR